MGLFFEKLAKKREFTSKITNLNQMRDLEAFEPITFERTKSKKTRIKEMREHNYKLDFQKRLKEQKLKFEREYRKRERKYADRLKKLTKTIDNPSIPPSMRQATPDTPRRIPKGYLLGGAVAGATALGGLAALYHHWKTKPVEDEL